MSKARLRFRRRASPGAAAARVRSPVCDESDPEAVCARQAAGVDNVLADELNVLGGALFMSDASPSEGGDGRAEGRDKGGGT